MATPRAKASLITRVIAAVRAEFDDVTSVSYQSVQDGYMLFCKRRGMDERVTQFTNALYGDMTEDELIGNILATLE